MAAACACRYFEEAPERHDAWLAVFESPTPRGLREFLEDLVAYVDFESELHIEWDQLVKFVASHNSTDPIAVCEVAEWVQHAMDLYATDAIARRRAASLDHLDQSLARLEALAGRR